MSGVVDATVVIRTIGRPDLLRACLESVAACDPRPAEILVVDQDSTDETRLLVETFADAGARRVGSDRRSRPAAANVGLRAAAHDVVFFTDDDCTVEPDWIARGNAHVSGRPDLCVTGRILVDGDIFLTPVLRRGTAPQDYTGRPHKVALYACNVACHRRTALALGGFDERLPTMEDWDFGYRWVKSGRRLAFTPEMVVWHHDWRTEEQMREVWREYAVGVARFYRRLARAGDPNVLRFFAHDFRQAARGLRGEGEWPHGRLSDPRVSFLRDLLRTLPRPSPRGPRS
jgi:GT2 family glycosyltransferase